MISFRIRGLPAQEFSHLFNLPDSDLQQHCAMRMIADGGGYPCRISLTDAAPGDAVILVNYQHHRTDTPFRSNFAIYVRADEQMYDVPDQVPQQLRKRLLSLRGYDSSGMLRTADVVEGLHLEGGIDSLLQDPRVAYLHAHFAKPGCYAALIERN